MYTLVFDTCFNKTYVVLKNDEKILDSFVITSTDENYHSVYLVPKIRDILKKHSILIKDISAIGVNIGPGSFTGIRAGITIARVLAQTNNIKLVGVPSMQVLSKLNNEKTNTVVVLDARKHKVYYAMYNANTTIVEPMLVDKEEVASKIEKDSIVVSDNVYTTFLKENGINAINFEEQDEKLGLYLAELTSYYLNNVNDDYNWAKVKPLYIQPPSISKPKANKNV